VRVWIDTDVGDNPDDAVALLLAARTEGVEVAGVSTVRGDVEARARVASALLHGEGVDPFVYAGPPDPRALATADAVLAIGPLTNLARLLDAGAVLPPVAAMAGALHPVLHRGAVREVETNASADPAALARLVDSATELLLVPLDVTARMLLRGDELARLLAAAPALQPSVSAWLARLDTERVPPADRAVCLHDPLALLALTGSPVVTIEPRSLAVRADGRVVEADAGRWCDVVVGVERDAAVTRVLGALAAGGRAGPPARELEGD
jgi:purine nucleosidase